MSKSVTPVDLVHDITESMTQENRPKTGCSSSHLSHAKWENEVIEHDDLDLPTFSAESKEENTDRPTTGRSSREARENEVIDDEPDVSTASTGGFGRNDVRPATGRSSRTAWENEVIDHVPTVSAGVQEEFSRPNSGRLSRAAWENDVFDHGPDIPTISAGLADTNAPAAMSRDVYASSQSPPSYDEKPPATGIYAKIKKFVRGFWGTRQTEDTQGNRELYIRTTIRELIVYVCFLITLCILTFGMTSSTHYYYTKVMQELFIDSEFPDGQTTFRDITTMLDFWAFAEGPLLDGLFWEKYYNNQNISDEDLGYIYYENRLLGVARIRQLKVRNGSCEVHPDFQEEITSCYDSYSREDEDTEPFGPERGTAWIYHTEETLNGSSHWGLLDYTYSGGGYYQDLSDTRATSSVLIEDLKANLWIDRGSRVVFIDFTVYNANINLFCVVRLVVEFPATGGAVPSWQFRTVKLLRYVTTYDFFLLGCEGLYMLFILYYIIEEILEIKKLRCSYFSGVWNCLDILVILLSVAAVAFNIYRTLTVDSLLSGLLENPSTYPDFEFLGFWQVQYNNMVAVVVFFAWIKIFKYISFNRTMTQLQSTLSRCSKDIAGFAIMFFIIFLAYAQLGYLVFGTQVKDFSTFPESIFTQFRIILGDFDFHALESANRILGPIFFLSYVFFVFFVLLNMFLAIINDTYSEVKAEISAQKSEFEITDYIKRGYNKVLEKLSLKKDRIKDIQDAIKKADLNQDRELDWEEWRLDLKMRGIPDAEIEALFAKYDQDGDMILNYNEQRKLHIDLEKQRSNINEELAEIRDNKSSARPASARSAGAVSHVSSDSFYSDAEYYSDTRPLNAANFASKDEFEILSRRVDRMERSVGAVVSKIDAVIVKLEAIERAKVKRQETLRVLDNISETDRAGRSDNELLEEHVQKKIQLDLGSSLSLRSSKRAQTSSSLRSPTKPHSLFDAGSNIGDNESRIASRLGDTISRPQTGMVNENEPQLADEILSSSPTPVVLKANKGKASRPQSIHSSRSRTFSGLPPVDANRPLSSYGVGQTSPNDPLGSWSGNGTRPQSVYSISSANVTSYEADSGGDNSGSNS